MFVSLLSYSVLRHEYAESNFSFFFSFYLKLINSLELNVFTPVGVCNFTL